MWKRDLSVGKVATFYLVFASFSPRPPPFPSAAFKVNVGQNLSVLCVTVVLLYCTKLKCLCT